MGVRSLDHVGVVVDDLEAAIAFFVDLGLEREEAGTVEGEWVDKVVGLDGVRARSKGLNTVGEVQDYEETFRLCYVRGPEGIIVELAEQIGSNATA
jgi:hypothetical protein